MAVCTVPVPQFLRPVGQTLNERPSTSQHDSANRQQAFAGSSLLSSFYSFFSNGTLPFEDGGVVSEDILEI